MRDPGPHQLDRLARGALVVVGVRPRALLADIHLRVLVGIEPGSLRHLAEGLCVQLGRAGGHDHPVQLVILDVRHDLLLGRVRAREHGRAGDLDPGLVLDGLDHPLDIDVVGDVAAAVADIDADPALAHAASLQLLEMSGYLGRRGAGVQDRLGDVLRARGRAGDADAGNTGQRWVQVLVWLGHVVELVEGELAAGEERPGVAVGLDADRQHDQVVLGLGGGAAVFDVFVAEDDVAFVRLADLGHASLSKLGAHRARLLVELVVALADGAHVDVVDGQLGQRQYAHDQLVLLDRVHAAEFRAEGFPTVWSREPVHMT